MNFFQINTQNREVEGFQTQYGNFEFLISETRTPIDSSLFSVDFQKDPTRRFCDGADRRRFTVLRTECNFIYKGEL